VPSVGRVHFETYTAQNRVKHAILSKYLGAYLTALSGVESDATTFEKLEEAVRAAPAGRTQLEAPWLLNAEFSQCVDAILTRPAFRTYRAVATFAFVDPWGLKGVYLADLAKILAMPFGECLALFNYDGLNRWVGAVRAGSHERDKLDRFFGSGDAADE
jgi:three-Cys-motif partner protein